MVNRGSDPVLEPGVERAQRRAGTGRTSQLPPGMNLRTPLTPEELEAISGSFFEEPHPEYRSPTRPIPKSGERFATEDIVALQEAIDRGDPNVAGGLSEAFFGDFIRNDPRREALDKLQTSKPGAMMTALQAGFGLAKEAAGPIPPAIGSGISKTFTTPFTTPLDRFEQPAYGTSLIDRLDRGFGPIDELGFVAMAVPLEILPDSWLPGIRERNDKARDLIVAAFFDNEGNFSLPLSRPFTSDPRMAELAEGLMELNIDRPWYERILSGMTTGEISGGMKLSRMGAKTAVKVIDQAILGGHPIRAASETASLVRRGFRGTGTFDTVIDPPKVAAEVLGLKPIANGLTPIQEIKNITRGLFGFTRHESITMPAFAEAARIKHISQSDATGIGHAVEAAISHVFKRDPEGRIDFVKQGITAKPTVADLAENLDDYWEALNAAQRKVMDDLRDALKPFDDVVKEMGDRRLIFKGRGFYVPRGSVKNGQEHLVQKGTGSGTSLKPRTQDTQSGGMDRLPEGFEYPSVRVAVTSNIIDVYNRAMKLHIKNYLLNAVDPDTGIRVAVTRADRINISLKNEMMAARNAVSSALRTAGLQTTRINVLDRIVQRAVKASERGFERLGKRKEILGKASEDFTPTDIRSAREDLREAISESQDFSYRVGETTSDLKRANKKLTANERKLFNAIEQLDNDVIEADRFLNISPAKGSITDVKAAEAAAMSLSRRVENLSELAEEAAGKVDDLEDARNISKNMLASERQNITQESKNIRNLSIRERVLMGYNREVRMLEREQARLQHALIKAETSADKAKIRHLITGLKLDEARTTKARLDPLWDKSIRSSASIGLGQGEIADFGLQGVGFPAEVAQAAKAVLDDSKLEQVRGGLEAYNSFYRGLRSTGDFSAVGIQGLLAMHSAPKASLAAMEVMFRAMGTERSLGAFMNQFNNITKAAGRADMSLWAKFGLHIGGGDTEFKLAIPTKLLKAAAGKFNRSFGYYGDTVRLGWADSILQDEMNGGGIVARFVDRSDVLKKIPGAGLGQKRTLQEIIESGDMEKIAKHVNNATGWTEGRAFGTAGDLLLFAPRFLNSRLTTAVNALKGTVPGASIENRLARRAVTRLVAQGMFLTWGLNRLQGEDTDFHPWLDDEFKPTFTPSFRKNPNFVRVRMFGQDWSMFGTWDSLLSAIINPLGASRGLASGPVQIFLDQATRATFLGEEVPNVFDGSALDDPIAFGGWLLQAHLPFPTEGTYQGVKKIAEGDLLGGPATLLGEMAGGKSSPVTPNEEVAIARANVLEEMGDDPRIVEGDYYKQVRPVRREIDHDSRVQDKMAGAADYRRLRQSGWQAYVDDREDEKIRFKDSLDAEAQRWIRSKSGFLNEGEDAIFGRGIRGFIHDAQIETAGRRDEIREKHKEALEFDYSENPTRGPEDEAYNHYVEKIFDEKLDDNKLGHYDYDERNARLETLRHGPILDDKGNIIEGLENGYGDEIIDQVEAELRDGEPGIISELRSDRKLLKGYFEVLKERIVYHGLEDVWRQYRNEPPEERHIFLRRTDIDPMLAELLSIIDMKLDVLGGVSIRERWILDQPNPEWADRTLIKWGYRTTAVTKTVKDEIEARAIGKAKQAQNK